jgi:hypothetical protein
MTPVTGHAAVLNSVPLLKKLKLKLRINNNNNKI